MWGKQDLERGHGYKRRINKVAPLPWHGRSTYGGLKNGLWTSPSELCTEELAIELINKASKSVDKASGFIEEFFK
ncbi:MAG: hypothetical protein KGZ49_06915 [Syntrophaceae bacterium]|nr:hypothetical protein [Syntrophaceae bacterium]